jgi:hypothetical protein
MLDENAYRDTYEKVNPLQCVFERAILRRCCGCEYAIRRNIAEREAAGCMDVAAQAQCAELKKTLRHASAFTLKLTHPDEPLPHGKQLKLQCGGLRGIAHLAGDVEAEVVLNIYAAVSAVVKTYGSIEQLPYQEIIQYVRAYQPRQHRK